MAVITIARALLTGAVRAFTAHSWSPRVLIPRGGPYSESRGRRMDRPTASGWCLVT